MQLPEPKPKLRTMAETARQPWVAPQLTADPFVLSELGSVRGSIDVQQWRGDSKGLSGRAMRNIETDMAERPPSYNPWARVQNTTYANVQSRLGRSMTVTTSGFMYVEESSPTSLEAVASERLG